MYDQAVNKVLSRIDSVSSRVAENFKNVKPFDKKEIPKSDLLQAYSQLGTQDMEYLVARHGRESINKFIQDMEVLKRRKTQ